jgi:uncharacterized membrane protein
LLLCGVLALAFAFGVPPLQVPDEHGHFVRAFLISRGKFVDRGIPELPVPIVSFVMRYPEAAEVFRKFTPQEIIRDLAGRAVTEQGTTALTTPDEHHRYLVWAVIGSATYCPLVYLPASFGIWTARALQLSPLVMMYTARIFNVLTFVGALAISFRLAPSYVALMTAVALIPMTLQQAAGISGDLVTIAISFVGFSLLLYAREHFVSRRILILVSVVFVMWSLCKFSLWSLPLLFLIPSYAFKTRRAWLAYIVMVSICMLGSFLIWNGITSANVEAFRIVRLTRGIDIRANAQLLAHPLTFAPQLLVFVKDHFRSELGQFLGAFGGSKFALPLWTRLLYLLLLVMVAATEPSTKPFFGRERGVLLLVFLAGAVFVHAAIFLSDGTLCGGNLDRLCFAATAGVQGRYFIPFCLAGFLALRQNRTNMTQARLLVLVTVGGAIQASAALALIRSTFYG